MLIGVIVAIIIFAGYQYWQFTATQKTQLSEEMPAEKVIFEDCVLSLIAPEGLAVGQNIERGVDAEVRTGNIVPLKYIPEGVPIFNIESKPGDGGKFVRASGSFAVVTSKDEKEVVVRLPSGAFKGFNPMCRATIGVIAGGGRTDKFKVKAGTNYHIHKAKNKLYPRVSASKMNPVDHPFGGGRQHVGKPTTTSSRAPPGRKVGNIGKKRRKR